MELESIGTVVWWSDEEGLGAIESPQVPGGCWVHFTHVLAGGHRFRTLEVGQAVPFAYEAAEQDGYAFRAVWVGSFAPGEPRRPDLEATEVITGPSSAYTSTLTITYDDHQRDDGEGDPVV